MSMEVTLSIPDELAPEVRSLKAEQLPLALELGIRKIKGDEEFELTGLRDVLEKLAALPTPQEVLALRPSRALERRLSSLLEKNRNEGLSPEEDREWRRYEFVEHLVRLAKTQAAIKLRAAGES
jgi:hypothetical protein